MSAPRRVIVTEDGEPASLGAGKANLTLAASDARTTSGTGPDVIVLYGTSGLVVLDITDVTGTTPTLDVVIEGKDATSGAYVTVATFAQQTAVGTIPLHIGHPSDTRALPRTIRARWTIGGTNPSFTFSIGLST